MHYVLVNEYFTWSGIVPVMLPYVAQVDYVNLNAAETTWQHLAAPIDDGRIILVDGFDWVANTANNLLSALPAVNIWP